MVVLTGQNLGERHRDLNNKVKEYIENKKSFNDIKTDEELTDVDKLYKIDIASHYKDVDYLIQTLKSGDTLCISKVLKCLWFYNDRYGHIINPEYLHLNLFPYMSVKMKKKMLKTISTQICNSERAASFFIYCKRNAMGDIAMKFLISSSEEFKLDAIKNENISISNYINQKNYLNFFIGNSFVIAMAYIKDLPVFGRLINITQLSHLYVINNEKYLDILEEYEKSIALNPLGIRISKDIMNKYKNRVLKNPKLYVNIINKSALVKYSSEYNAKQYLSSLMPQEVKEFWETDFCTVYKYILDIIPTNEKFEFMQQLFNTKYPGEDFEMSVNFYNLKYYDMQTVNQRELWALRHINEQKEILGLGKDYIWYRFVNIDKALTEIKRLIYVITDNDKRTNILCTLVQASKDQKDLLKVLNYYNDRHVNELINDKMKFVDEVLNVHNVFDFNTECWEALNKIFISLEVYAKRNSFNNKFYMAVAIACHILHNKEMPQALIDFIDLDVNYIYFSYLLEKHSHEKSEIVYQYLLKIFVDKLKPFENQPLHRNIKKSLKKYVNNIHNLMNYFKKSNEECPDVVKKISDILSPKPKEKKKVTAKDLLRLIKTDSTQAVAVLSHFNNNITEWPGIWGNNSVLNTTYRKLKSYFQQDVAKEFTSFFDSFLRNLPNDYGNYHIIHSIIFAIFQLADENLKVALMEKYRPLEPKIDHSVINRDHLHIQSAVCKFIGYSRPPVPLQCVLQYIKGDYVHYCLPLIDMYSVILPPASLVNFTNGILNMPLSIQKHGLRLAFKCFSNENLKSLLVDTWKKTKNVSLRKIIYMSLFGKITNSGNNDELGTTELYEDLKFFTADLNQDDDEVLFRLLSSHKLPDKFINDYLATAWDMLVKLPKKPVNINRQSHFIRSMEEKMDLGLRDFIRKRIIDEHVHEILEQHKLRPHKIHEFTELSDSKWELTKAYIVRYNNKQEMVQSLELLNRIFKICASMWNDKYEESRIFRKFYFNFIYDLQEKSLCLWNELKSYDNIPIFKNILDMLLGTFPLNEIYLTVWDLKLMINFELSLNYIDSLRNDRGEKLKTLSPEEFRMICNTFANHLRIFFTELLAKDQFYAVFLPAIAKLITTKFHPLMIMSKENDIFEGILCESLTNIAMKETHLLTVMVLEELCGSEPQAYLREILKKIQAFQNGEVQSYILQIYGNIL